MITSKILSEVLQSDELKTSGSKIGQAKRLNILLMSLFVVWTIDFFAKVTIDKHLSLDGVNYFFHMAHTKMMKIIINISGYLLLVTGILILTNQLQALGFYLIEYFP